MFINKFLILLNVFTVAIVGGLTSYAGVMMSTSAVKSSIFATTYFKYVSYGLLAAAGWALATILSGVNLLVRRKNERILFIMDLLLVVILTGLVISYFFWKDKQVRAIEKNFKKIIKRDNVTNQEINFWQKTLKCCGGISYKEYRTAPPESCVVSYTEFTKTVYSKGCVTKYVGLADHYRTLFLTSSGVVLMITLSIVILFYKANGKNSDKNTLDLI